MPKTRNPNDIERVILALIPTLRAALQQTIRDVLDERLLTVREAAESAGLSEAALRKRITREQIPVIRIGRTVRVRLSAVTSNEHPAPFDSSRKR